MTLKWLHQAQFAGHYVADQKGWYKENRLVVSLMPFDFEKFPVTEVAAGRAEFGVTGADEILLARAEGVPVVAVAVIYQDNPVVAYALQSSGIEKPVDLIGKRVGIQEGTNVDVVIRSMLADQNISLDDEVNAVSIGFDVTAVLEGEVDAASGYLTNEPIQIEELGYDVNVINPINYGVSAYADVLFTTEGMIENNPDLVQRFVDATLDGWEYALINKEEAVNYTLLYEDPNNDALNFDHQMSLLEASIPLIKPAPGSSVGQMEFEVWKKTHDLLREGGLLESDINITDAYTTEFLQ